MRRITKFKDLFKLESLEKIPAFYDEISTNANRIKTDPKFSESENKKMLSVSAMITYDSKITYLKLFLQISYSVLALLFLLEKTFTSNIASNVYSISVFTVYLLIKEFAILTTNTRENLKFASHFIPFIMMLLVHYVPTAGDFFRNISTSEENLEQS